MMKGVKNFILYYFSLHGTIGAQHADTQQQQFDANGYLFYCPCHGRFGNQADQLLGSLQFAKALNRTAILPPFRSYNYRRQGNVAFDTLFQVEPLRAYHRVILASEFMRRFAAEQWPPEQRRAYCIRFPRSKFNMDGCHMKIGQPFEGFWNELNVDFIDDDVVLDGLHYRPEDAEQWRERCPAAEHPVIALKGPPAPFPSPLRYWPMQRYIEWNHDLLVTARSALRRKSAGFEPGNCEWWRAVNFFIDSYITV